MQFISKKVIAFNMLLLNFSISFGCFNQDEQMACKKGLLIVGVNSDGKVKNLLQKTDKFFYEELSINNNDSLLRLNTRSLAEVDIQKILLRALWRDNETDQSIVERYKEYYNKDEKISLKNFFGDNKFILEDRNIKWGLSLFGSSITFAKIKEIKTLLLNYEVFKELNSFKTSNIHQMLQVGALCGDVILVQTISKKILNMFNKISDFIAENIDNTNYTTQRDGRYYVSLETNRMHALRDAFEELNIFENNSIESTKLLLLKLMYLNKKEMFQALVDANPLKLTNSRKWAKFSDWTTIIEYFQDGRIDTIDNNVNKAEYIEILKEQLKK